jgi:hypothetical protein
MPSGTLPSRTRTTVLTRITAALALASTLACGDGTSARTGRITLLLTDAPGDFRKAVVTIDRIYLQGSADEDAEQVVLREEDVTTDLLTLANSTAELVEDAVIPAGRYAQLRFVVTGAYIEVENADGSTSIYASSPTYAGLPAGAQVAGPLQLPSYASSGLKVNLPGGAVSVGGDAKVLLVDFDVARSFGHGTGNTGWVMTPVLEASLFDLTGGIVATLEANEGVTLPSINGTPATLGGFSAVLTNAAGSRETIALTDANADGTYEAAFKYLAPGDYMLDFAPPSDSITFVTTPTRPVAVQVGSTLTLTRPFLLMSASK